MRNFNLLKSALFFLMISGFVLSGSGKTIDIRGAEKIAVLDDGRKMPLHSYARKKLIQISGRSKIGSMSSMEWFLKLMCNPGALDTVSVFRIMNPETVDALGIKGPYKRRYSYSELYYSLDKCQQIATSSSKKKYSEMQPFEREILQIWNNLQEYNSIGAVFSAFDPRLELFTLQDTALASSLNVQPNRSYSFTDMIRLSAIFSARLENIRTKNLDSLTGGEKELLHLVRTMHDIGSQMQKSPPYFIPVTENGNEEWYGVWGYLNKSGNSALNDKRVLSLLQLKDAYLAQDSESFTDALTFLTSAKYEGYPHPGLEVIYNKLNPFFWARIFLALAAVITLLDLFYSRKWSSVSSSILIGAGFLMQTTGLLLRVLIQMHPPLASLYETFVVVSWIIVILGVGLEIFQKRNLGKVIASLGGFLFLVISGRYAVNGDTFGVIAAVLNSGFWLTIHIVTISIGYAGFLISGLLGHLYLVQILLRTKENVVKSTFQAVYVFMLLGLAFTVTGTVLGGMWADQAWGRFWGWDPKENGALLIILWGSAVIHARRGKLIGPAGTSVCAVIGILMVMFAWIGVNLLGIGLHSYGFTHSGLNLLITMVIFETLFLVCSGFFAYKLRPGHLSSPTRTGSK